MFIQVAFNKLISKENKQNNVYITNPLLVYVRTITMAFITSKLVVQQVEEVHYK